MRVNFLEYARLLKAYPAQTVDRLSTTDIATRVLTYDGNKIIAVAVYPKKRGTAVAGQYVVYLKPQSVKGKV